MTKRPKPNPRLTVREDDVEDPYDDRTNPGSGRHRHSLNLAEREMVRVNRALAEWPSNEKTFAETLEELNHPIVDSHEITRLSNRYDQVWEMLARFIVDCYTDPTTAQMSDKQIAARIGIDPRGVRRIKQDDRFRGIYNTVYGAVTADPRVHIVQERLPELAPVWFQRLIQLMTEDDVKDTVRLNTLKWYAQLTGMQMRPDEGNERKELAKFLDEAGKVQIHLHVPEKYAQAYEEVVEGEVRDVPDLPDQTDEE